MKGQEKLVKGQEKIDSEFSKMSISIDNLAREIGDLVQKINSNGIFQKRALYLKVLVPTIQRIQMELQFI